MTRAHQLKIGVSGIRGVVGEFLTPNLASAFAQAFGTSRAAIHQNHGHFTVGSTIDEAVFWFVCFERCAQAQLAAMAAGTPKLIPHESAVYTRENAGNAITGWMHFQPLWQEICRTDPDLFD